MAGTTHTRARDTRQEILEVAAKLVARFTMPKLTMEDVARAAGVTRQTVYKHFSGKLELLTALYIEEIERHRRPAMETALTRPPSASLLTEVFLEQVELARGYAMHDPSLDTTAAPRTADLLFHSEPISAAWERLWIPVLERYAEAGLLRESVDLRSAVRWLMYHQYFLTSHPSVLPEQQVALESGAQAFILGGLLRDS